MVRIKVLPLGKTLEGESGENLFLLFQRKNIPLESYCGGVGSCGKCVVRIVQGEVSLPTPQEVRRLGERIGEGFRLACQVVPLGDVVCDISASLEGVEVPVLGSSGEGDVAFFANDVPVRRSILRLRKPPLHSPTSLKEELERMIAPVSFERVALSGLSLFGEKDEETFEVLWDERAVFAVRTPPKETVLGLAFDLGTTTVACELLDLASGRVLAWEGALNRQVRFGADVISRLRAVQERFENLEALQRDVVETMNALAGAVCQQARLDPRDVVAVSVCGNTIMEHLFLGLSPLSIGVVPFVPVLREGYVLRAEELALSVHPGAQVYVFPAVAGYVGGDVLAGLGAFRVHEAERTTLYIDIGTNGEMVLVHRGEVFACGTAAGPAFEGVGVRFGMRASLGAIHALRFEQGRLSFSTIGGVPPRGICGTGLLDLMAGLLAFGLLSSTGRFRKQAEWASFFEEEQGERRFIVSRDPLIFITEKDIENLQLALGAMKAGRDILLKEARLKKEDIEEVILAGAFGSFIKPESARVLGLIPQKALARSVGNAALLGARKALVSLRFRDEVERLARRVHYIELSARRDFEDAFCDALLFES